MTWLNPGLLGFLALGGIPIIIYLINRQRYQRVPWAAMEFLLRAMKKHRRRLRFENLLLLLIRTAIVLLFVLAMARPSLESGALPVLGESGRSELFLVDRSYSMALQSTGRSSLRVVADAVSDRVKSLEKGDRVGLIFGGGFPDVVTPTPEIITEASAPLVLDQLEQVEITYEAFEAAPLLSVASDWISSGSARETPWIVHIYSDLQKADWLAADSTVDPAIREALSRLEEQNAKIFLHPVTAVRPRNVTLSSIRCSSQLLAIDLPTTFQVTVENHGKEAVAGIEAELWIDDEVQGSRRISVDPGERTVVSFPHIFRTVGPARVRAVVRSDDLDVDNERTAVFEVRESVEVLIVDGSRTSGDEISEADWLVAALGGVPVTETGVRLSPFTTDTVVPERWADRNLSDTRVLIFVDVPEFSEREVERVEAFLNDGGGILFFPGTRFRIAEYLAGSWRGGNGWFPYEPLEEVIDRSRETFYHFEIADADHPTMEYLAETPDAGIALVAIHGFLRPGSTEGSEVLMRLDDFSRTPALVAKPFGKGVTIASITGAGRRWSNFPTAPAYLPFLFETLPYLATRDQISRNLAIGEPFRRVVPSEEFRARVLLVRPSGDGVPVVLEERDDKKSFDLSIPGQGSPGAYEIRFGGMTEGAGRSEWFAVNADPSEGNLTAVVAEDVTAVYPTLALVAEVREVEAPEDYGTGELWMPIFWAVLTLLIAESALARFFGGRRSRRG